MAGGDGISSASGAPDTDTENVDIRGGDDSPPPPPTTSSSSET